MAVIGGGVSGTYVAWGLLARDPEGARLGTAGAPKVGLFELSDRIGGRLWSVAPPGAPHLRAENGGMRYLPGQKIVFSLVDHLGLPSRPFPFGGPENLFYLRGRRLTVADIKAGKPVPYKLSPRYKGLTPSGVLEAVYKNYVPNAARLTPAQWLRVQQTLKIRGRPLYDYGMDQLVRQALEGDDWQYAHDGSGYLGGFAHVNAAQGIADDFVDFADPTYRTPVDGYQALPLALARKFAAAGGHIEMNARLRRLDRGDEVGVVLRFEGKDGPFTVRARHVVLAMPQRALYLLDKESFLFADKRFVADLDTVTPVAALKIHLAYETPWWGKLGLTSGRSTTDLPVRQCLYFGTEKDAVGGEPGNDRSLLVGTYANRGAVGYWKRLQTRYPDPYPSQGQVPAGLECSAAAVAAIQSQLSLIHGIPAPAPYWAVLRDWTQDPYGGGWHNWKVGVKNWEVMPRIRRPLLDAPVSICGEAYSNADGWVEGALQTAERVLQDQFGLAHPAWLPADANLGP